MAFLLQTFKASDCELFVERAPEMVSEMKHKIESFDPAKSFESVWEWLQQEAPYRKRDYKLHMCRFMAFQQANYTLLEEWTITLFKVEFLSLDLDFVKGRALKDQVLMSQSLLKDMAEIHTTSNEVVTVDVKLLRSACQNAVVITMMLLCEAKHRRVLAIMIWPARPLDEWHGMANAKCRSASDSREFFIGACCGDYFEHLHSIIETLTDMEVLSQCGFFAFECLLGDELLYQQTEDAAMSDLLGTMVLEVLVTMVMHILKVDEEEVALSRCAQRMSKMDSTSSALQELLNVVAMPEMISALFVNRGARTCRKLAVLGLLMQKGAKADDSVCQSVVYTGNTEVRSSWWNLKLFVAAWFFSMVVAAYCMVKSYTWMFRKAVRNVATQSQTTYTWLRKVQNPRFEYIEGRHDGVWTE